MPFGLANALVTFQRLTNRLSRKLQMALVYSNNIIAFSKEVEEHFHHLRLVLSVLYISERRKTRGQSNCAAPLYVSV